MGAIGLVRHPSTPRASARVLPLAPQRLRPHLDDPLEPHEDGRPRWVGNRDGRRRHAGTRSDRRVPSRSAASTSLHAVPPRERGVLRLSGRGERPVIGPRSAPDREVRRRSGRSIPLPDGPAPVRPPRRPSPGGRTPAARSPAVGLNHTVGQRGGERGDRVQGLRAEGRVDAQPERPELVRARPGQVQPQPQQEPAEGAAAGSAAALSGTT